MNGFREILHFHTILEFRAALPRRLEFKWWVTAQSNSITILICLNLQQFSVYSFLVGRFVICQGNYLCIVNI